MNFALTTAAIDAFELALKDKPTIYIRVGVKGAGCSGYQYLIEFEYNEPKENDFVITYPNFSILIDKKSAIYLNNSTLDYESSLMKSGFKFLNENEKAVCGCGKSVEF